MFVQYLYVCVKLQILIISGIPSTEETMNSLLTVIQSSSQSQLGSQQYSDCPVSEWNSGCSTNTITSNGQVGSVCFHFCFKNQNQNSSQISHNTMDCFCGFEKNQKKALFISSAIMVVIQLSESAWFYHKRFGLQMNGLAHTI